MRRLLIASVVVLALVGCNNPRRFADSGVRSDAQVPGVDAYVLPGVDANLPDAYVPGVDAYVPRVDAYVPSTPTSFAFTGSIATYLVPPGVTRVRIVAQGASGGDAIGDDGTTWIGGYGAIVDSTVTVTAGESLSVLVGEAPIDVAAGLDGCGASGGGGSFVARGTTVLVAAGGGGGATAYCSADGGDASTSESGGSSGAIAGGVGGNGGAGSSGEGGGGGGSTGSGSDGEGFGGASFAVGGAGGARASSESCGSTSNGGFGGGGGGGNDAAGGGGGYSGGAASDCSGSPSGGGGSFGMGAPSIRLATSYGHGSVMITPM